jgi:hypothetical protein
LRKLISPHRRLVGQADEPDLAEDDQPAQHAEDLVDRMAVPLDMQIVEPLEHAHRPIWPMKLVEIDVTGPEPLEAALDRLHDLRLAVPGR